MIFYQECIECGFRYGSEENVYSCKKCGDMVDIKYDYDVIRRIIERKEWRSAPLSVWRYWFLMPIHDKGKVVTLGEGGTTIHKCQRLANYLSVKHLYVKNEGENPTGSFKDRGMTVGVTRALELDARAVICASTGNTSASLSAYAAKAGLKCIVLVPFSEVARGKLAQAIVHGAQIIQVRGNFDQALAIVRGIAEVRSDIYLLNSVNPFRLEGQKTIAYEIIEQLNKVPDVVVVPIGNAGNISAIWKGFREFESLGLVNSIPRMIGVQAEGASPIALAMKKGLTTITPVNDPETVATAIRIGKPVNWKRAMKAMRESEGAAEIVSDKEILDAQRALARYEGIFAEPAGAASIAGVKKLVEYGEIDKDELTVCVVTGHGLKDVDIIMTLSKGLIEIDAEFESVNNILKEAIINDFHMSSKLAAVRSI